MIHLPLSGLTANCTFDPPVSTPIVLKHNKDQFRINCISLSDRVMAGATVTESPVWTPIGSMFSMEHTIIALSALSLITSSSNSFQPRRDSSIKTSVVGLALRPLSTKS